MDYSKMSDFEINSAMHNALMDKPYELEFLGNDKIRWLRDSVDVTADKVDYKKNTLRDYCNNPADAWPIIHGNQIDLSFGEHVHETLKGCCMASDNNISSTHDNPLRAAMIVFLKMQ